MQTARSLPPRRLIHALLVAEIAVVGFGALVGRSNAVTFDTPTVVSFDVAEDLSTGRVDLGTTTVELAFDFDPRSTEPQRITVDDLTVEYYSPALYEALGGTSLKGTMLLVTPLPYAARVNVVPGGPGEASEPATRWTAPDLPDSLLAFYDRMEAVNDQDLGILCDEDLDSLATYRQVEAGECYVWCDGLAAMAVDMLRSNGTPARMLSLWGVRQQLASGVLVQTSEGHASAERWDGRQWTWFDPTFNVAGATLDGRPLSLHDTIVALADRQTRDRVTFTRYAGGHWVTAPYTAQDDAFRSGLERYLTADKQLSIRTVNSPPTGIPPG